MMGTQVLVFKLKFENFIYHKIKIFTGGAYAPYAPCMGMPLAEVLHVCNMQLCMFLWYSLSWNTGRGARSPCLLALAFI